MNCFMFPGQPLFHNSQMPEDADFIEIADLTQQRTGLNLHDFNLPGNGWTESVMLQVYGVAMSLYRARRFRR